MRRLSVLAALILSLPSFAECKKDEFNRYLAAAVRLYEALEYERALDQLAKAKESSCGTDDDALLGMYEGTIRSDLGQTDQAKIAFKEALLLKPDAEVPLKVSPKVKKLIESLRGEAKKELAPILARQEQERRKKEADDAKKAEEARRADEARRAEEQRRADELRRLAETAKTEEARRNALAEAQRLDDERRAEEARRTAANGRSDRPEQHNVSAVPIDEGTGSEPVVKTQLKTRRVVPVLPFVFAGVALACGGVATYFGVTSHAQQQMAIMTTQQLLRAMQLSAGNQSALIADILIGVAGAAAVATLIGLIAGPWSETVAETVR